MAHRPDGAGEGSPVGPRGKATRCAVAAKGSPDPPRSSAAEIPLQRCLNEGQARLLYPPTDQPASSQESRQLAFGHGCAWVGTWCGGESLSPEGKILVGLATRRSEAVFLCC